MFTHKTARVVTHLPRRRVGSSPRGRARLIGVGAAAAVLAGSLGLTWHPAPADAVETRPGAAFGQIDVLLDGYETDRARQDAWSAGVTCWDAGAGDNPALMAMCIPMVSVCAARAYYAQPRQRAGLTVTIWGDAWCWKY